MPSALDNNFRHFRPSEEITTTLFKTFSTMYILPSLSTVIPNGEDMTLLSSNSYKGLP